MSIDKTFTSDVRTDADYADIPATALFAIDPETRDFIRKMAEVVKEHGLYQVEKFDYRVVYTNAAELVAADSGTLHVSHDYFWFSALLRHTSVEVYTDSFSITDLGDATT